MKFKMHLPQTAHQTTTALADIRLVTKLVRG